jgi:hypothetical protein
MEELVEYCISNLSGTSRFNQWQCDRLTCYWQVSLRGTARRQLRS